MIVLLSLLFLAESWIPQAQHQSITSRTSLLLAKYSEVDRRTIIQSVGMASPLLLSQPSTAAVGSLPEFANVDSILQGITVKVADRSQQEAMVDFLTSGFSCQVLRKRIIGQREETWLGFGPEQFSIPSDFTYVNSFAMYGGHASIRIVYDVTLSKALYRIGDTNPPGTNIAYLQLGVPEYRISQMVRSGGVVLDAYGFVNVISPSGLPVRGIVGIRPDPLMFVAINCANVKESQAFYEAQGFALQEYPFARPSNGKGQFEPPQPANSVYLAPSPNSMGVLLIPTKKKASPSVNEAVECLNIVTNSDEATQLVDPSKVVITQQTYADFEREEKITR